MSGRLDIVVYMIGSYITAMSFEILFVFVVGGIDLDRLPVIIHGKMLGVLLAGINLKHCVVAVVQRCPDGQAPAW